MDAIATIEAEIDKLEARISGLRYARELLGGATCTVEVYTGSDPCPPTATFAEPPAKKPTPPVAPSRPEAGRTAPAVAARHEANREKRRHGIAQHLAAKGPTSFGDLERLTGVQTVTLRDLLRCPYFEKTDPSNRLSPWTLTESGRKFAESNGPG